VGVPGFVDEPDCSWKEPVLVCEVLVLMERSLLPEGRDSTTACPGRERPAAAAGSWRQTSHAANDGGAEDGLDGGGVEVHHHGLWQVELL